MTICANRALRGVIEADVDAGKVPEADAEEYREKRRLMASEVVT